MSTPALSISPDLLEILRDPYAIQLGDQFGPDPGQLTLVQNTWLVSADTGYKYPIRDGIPVMLVEEGARWKDTPVDALPVPPPSAMAEQHSSVPAAAPAKSSSQNYLVLVAVGGLVLLAGLIGISWLRGRHNSSDAQ